jgi:outer membrane lipoprotein-sorting protein
MAFGRKVLVGAMTVAIAIPALAQVPMPNSRPPTATGSTAPRPSQPAPQAQATPQQQAPAPLNNPFAALLGRTTGGGNMTLEQRAVVDKVSAYLSSIQNLSGQFVQVGPDGRRAEGQFFIQKPGKVRFDYDPPAKIDIIADGQSMVVRDRSLGTQDVYPLSQTPLRFLLSNNVDLVRDTNLTALYTDNVFVTVVVEENNPIIGKSRLMVMFSAKDLQLKQWTVTDPQGYDTTVAVYNLDTMRKPDPAMFRIDYTRYRN